MALVGYDEAFAGRTVRHMPKIYRYNPPVREERDVDEKADAFLVVLDAYAPSEETLSQEDDFASTKTWRLFVDKARATLGEEDFRATLQQRGIDLDDFLFAEPRNEFVSLTRISYDELYRA